jgi:hypothetical protein
LSPELAEYRDDVGEYYSLIQKCSFHRVTPFSGQKLDFLS